MTLTESSRKGSALAQFRQIYRWQLKRSRLISILCLGLTFLCFSVVHLCESVRSYHDYFDNPSELGENVSHAYLLKQFAGTIQANLMTGMATILIPLLLVFLVVSAIQTFSICTSGAAWICSTLCLSAARPCCWGIWRPLALCWAALPS